LLSDYTTSDNIHLYKGQHVQIVQRLNNEFSIVQLLNTNNNVNNSSSSNISNPMATTTASTSVSESATSPTTATSIVQPKQLIEVQVPNSIIKCRIKSTFDGIFFSYYSSNSLLFEFFYSNFFFIIKIEKLTYNRLIRLKTQTETTIPSCLS
jgi:hypothetical protein